MLTKVTKNLLDYAIFKEAREIDIDKEKSGTTVRFLIDGNWEYIIDFPKNKPDVGKEIKELAKLQTKTEKDKTQELNRFKINDGINKVVFNISSFPKKIGERLILSIGQEQITLLELANLGIPPHQNMLITENLKRPKGLTLVIGCPGSGVTTTLYSLTNYINDPHINISSIEHKVECDLPGVNQLQADPKIGYSIADGLYYLARHNSDIIMVNDINEPQASKTSFEYLLKGVPMFASLNADDIGEGIARLLKAGVKGPHLSSALNIVVFQRLVEIEGKIKREYQTVKLEDNLLALLKKPRFSKSEIENVINA